jgi:peroxiredoxin
MMTLPARIVLFRFLTDKKLLWLLPLAAVSLLAFFNLRVMHGWAKVKEGQMPKPTLARQTFSTMDGKRFSLEATRGKVVVVQFFGTWCGISKRQVATNNKLLESGSADGLQLIGMAVKDSRSNSQALKQFISEQKVGYSVVSDVDDKYFVDFVDSRDVSVPQTLIYGRDGRLVAHYLGYNQQIGTEIEQKVKNELASK